MPLLQKRLPVREMLGKDKRVRGGLPGKRRPGSSVKTKAIEQVAMDLGFYIPKIIQIKAVLKNVSLKELQIMTAPQELRMGFTENEKAYSKIDKRLQKVLDNKHDRETFMYVLRKLASEEEVKYEQALKLLGKEKH